MQTRSPDLICETASSAPTSFAPSCARQSWPFTQPRLSPGAVAISGGSGEAGVDSHLAHEGRRALVEQPDLLHVADDGLMHLAAEQFAEEGVLAAERDLLACVAHRLDVAGAHAERLVGFARELSGHYEDQRLAREVLEL